MSAAAQPSAKCSNCNGTGRWMKDVLVGKPQESVYCPHCHGTGAGGADVVVAKASGDE